MVSPDYTAGREQVVLTLRHLVILKTKIRVVLTEIGYSDFGTNNKMMNKILGGGGSFIATETWY